MRSHSIFVLFLGGGFLNLAKNQIDADLFKEFTDTDNGYKDPYDWEIIGKNLFIMGIEGLIFLFLNLVWEKFFDQKIPKSSGMDVDGVLVVKNVTKTYTPTRFKNTPEM